MFACTVLAALFVGQCATASAQAYRLASPAATSGESANGNSFAPAISADGRHIAFASTASNLVANDTNGSTQDVFVNDTQSGQTTLVSTNLTGTGSGNGVSRSPKMSADGRYVAFISSASDLVANDTNGSKEDIFVRDMQANTTVLASMNFTGTGSGNGPSTSFVFSTSGHYVAFDSSASDLVSRDDNGFTDVFIRDLVTNSTTLVSLANSGVGANAASSVSAISPDGRFIAYTSSASNLVANDMNGFSDVFVLDLVQHAAQLVSVNSAGTASADGNSSNAVLSTDGRHVAFVSTAKNLTTDDANNVSDVYARDLATGVNSRVSFDEWSFEYSYKGASAPAMSDDGRYVLYVSTRQASFVTRLSTLTQAVETVYRRDLTSGALSSSSGPANGSPETPSDSTCSFGMCDYNIYPPSISADGRYAAYTREIRPTPNNFLPSTKQLIYVKDFLYGGTYILITPTTAVSALAPPAISANTAQVAFVSSEQFVSADTNSHFDIYKFTPGARAGQFTLDASRLAREDEPAGSFDVIRSGVFGDVPAASVSYTVADATARAGIDYDAASGTLSFAEGETSKRIAVTLKDDQFYEGPETFNITLSNPTASDVLGSPSTGSFTINDNESLIISSESVSPREGNAGSTPVAITLTLSSLIDAPLNVNFATHDVDAKAGSDYVSSSGVVTFNPGDSTKTITVQVTGDTLSEQRESFYVAFSTVDGIGFNEFVFIEDDDTPVLQFDSNPPGGSERVGSLLVYVRRTGDTSVPVSVAYRTTDGTASERSDYTVATGRLEFAPGETDRAISLLINDDAFVEGIENFTLTLDHPAGGAVVGPNNRTSVGIISDDEVAPTSNPVDESGFFVEQQYRDFLNRSGDTEGVPFWKNELNTLVANCQSRPAGDERAACILGARAHVSAAFFLSIEFQQTGYFVIRLYRQSFNRAPTLREFFADTQEVGRNIIVGGNGWEAKLEANKQKFAADWVARTEFKTAFDALSNSDYVRTLFANGGGDADAEKEFQQALVKGLDASPPTETRATVLRKVADSRTVYNRQYNPALVLMQYFGYLRRAPADAPDTNLDGYNFWLAKLDAFSLAGEDVRDANVALARIKRAQMVEAFIASHEYRARFGP